MKNKIILFRGKSSVDNKQKVPLIPLSLISLASAIRPEFTPIIFDGDVMSEQEIKEELDRHLDDTLCIAISALTGPQITDGLALATYAKKKNPALPVIWGGWHVSCLPDESIKEPLVDAIVIGLGQIAFPDILRRIRSGKPFDDINGILTKKNYELGTFRETVLTPNFLSGSPVPAFDLLDLEYYRKESVALLPFPEINGMKLTGFTFYPSSFGCPFACNFCCNKTVLHQRSTGYPIKEIVLQLKWLVSRGFNYVSFTDAEFFHNLDRVEAFCDEIIKEDCIFIWSAQASVQSILRLEKRGLLPKIRKSGGHGLCIGAESGSQKLLEYMNKKISVKETIESANILKKHQITATFNLLFGLPPEQKSNIIETFKMAYSLKIINPDSPLPISFYTPFPGTLIFDDAVKMGLHTPATLKEWGHYKTEYLKMAYDLPWRNPEHETLINDVLTFYLPIAVPGNMGRGTIQMSIAKNPA